MPRNVFKETTKGNFLSFYDWKMCIDAKWQWPNECDENGTHSNFSSAPHKRNTRCCTLEIYRVRKTGLSISHTCSFLFLPQTRFPRAKVWARENKSQKTDRKSREKEKSAENWNKKNDDVIRERRKINRSMSTIHARWYHTMMLLLSHSMYRIHMYCLHDIVFVIHCVCVLSDFGFGFWCERASECVSVAYVFDVVRGIFILFIAFAYTGNSSWKHDHENQCVKRIKHLMCVVRFSIWSNKYKCIHAQKKNTNMWGKLIVCA